MILKNFMRALSMRPVVRNVNGDEVLDKRVQVALDKLRSLGQDPLQQLRSCQDYLESCISSLRRKYNKKSRILKNKNPQRIGSLAWYEYMLNNTTTIVGFLVGKQLEEMINRGKENNT